MDDLNLSSRTFPTTLLNVVQVWRVIELSESSPFFRLLEFWDVSATSWLGFLVFTPFQTCCCALGSFIHGQTVKQGRSIIYLVLKHVYFKAFCIINILIIIIKFINIVIFIMHVYFLMDPVYVYVCVYL